MNTGNIRAIGRSLTSCGIALLSLSLSLATGCLHSPTLSETASGVTIYPLTSTTVGSGESVTLVATAGIGGVSWSISGTGCSGTACGTLTGATENSVNYVAPASLSGSNLSVTITATSAATPATSATTTLTIVPTVVSISPSSVPGIPSGISVTVSASVAYDVNNEGVTWSLGGVDCSGATCGTLTNQTPASVTYTSPQGDPGQVLLTATSIAVPSASASLSLSVPTLSSLIQVSPATLPVAIAGQPYSATLTVTGGTAPYTFDETSLPAWMTVTSTGDTITLAGTPTEGQPVLSSLQITAIDSSSPQSFAGVASYQLTTYPPGTGNSLLTGSYAFYGLGWSDADSIADTQRISYIGSFTTDGNGNITGGEMDVNGPAGLISYTSLTGDYSVEDNQTGIVTLQPASTPAVSPIILAVSLSGINSGSIATAGNFIQYDDSTGIGVAATGFSSGVRVSGLLGLQSSTALNSSASPLLGSYAFGMQGRNSVSAITTTCYTSSSAKCGAISLAGAITFGSGGTVSSGEEDVTQGATSAAQVSMSGSLNNSGNTDASGRLTASITASNSTLIDWPTDYIIYAVNPQTFYVMSSDSYVTSSLIAGDAELQNLTDIAAMPFDPTKPIIMYGNVLSTYNYPAPDGAIRAELQWLDAVPTSATAGSLYGYQYVNASGGGYTAGATTQTNYAYTAVDSHGRVNSTITGEPVLYLVDTGKGYAAPHNAQSGLFEFQEQTATTLNAGNYTFAVVNPNSEVGPLETGIVTIPDGGVSDSGTAVAVTGYAYASFSEAGDEDSNSAGSLLFSEPLTGSLAISSTGTATSLPSKASTTGLIPIGGFSLSSGIQGCANGAGFVISPTSFACISGAKSNSDDVQIHVFNQ